MAILDGYGTRTHGFLLSGAGRPSINWAHPLSKGLVACYVPQYFLGTSVPNLVQPGAGDIAAIIAYNGGFFTPGKTPEGRGIQYNSTQTGVIYGFNGSAPTAWQLSSGLSLFCRGLKTGNFLNTEFVFVFGLRNASGSNAPCIGGGGSPTGNGPFALFYNTGSTTYLGTSNPTTNTMVSAGATFASGAPAKLYVNGVNDPLGGSPPNVSQTYTSPVSVLMGNTGASAHPLNMTLTIGYIWTRNLTAQEHLYMSSNPYALLTWPQDIVYNALATPSSPPPATTPQPNRLGFFGGSVALGGAAYAERWLARRKAKIARLRGE